MIKIISYKDIKTLNYAIIRLHLITLFITIKEFCMFIRNKTLFFQLLIISFLGIIIFLSKYFELGISYFGYNSSNIDFLINIILIIITIFLFAGIIIKKNRKIFLYFFGFFISSQIFILFLDSRVHQHVTIWTKSAQPMKFDNSNLRSIP